MPKPKVCICEMLTHATWDDAINKYVCKRCWVPKPTNQKITPEIVKKAWFYRTTGFNTMRDIADHFGVDKYELIKEMEKKPPRRRSKQTASE